MKVDKTLLPAHRETSEHKRQLSQAEHKPLLSVWQSFGPLTRILQREAVFGLQLLLAFSVSYTAVQLTRGWLSESGIFAPAPSVYSARVFWPENTLAIFPKPQTTTQTNTQAAIQTAASSEPIKPSPTQVAPLIPAAPPVRLAITRQSAQAAPARLQTAPSRSAYRWAAPKARMPQIQRRTLAAYTAKRAPLPRPQYRGSARVAAHKPLQTSQAVRPVQRTLREEYRVSKLKSYEEYMSWVRKTLKEYNGG